MLNKLHVLSSCFDHSIMKFSLKCRGLYQRKRFFLFLPLWKSIIVLCDVYLYKALTFKITFAMTTLKYTNEKGITLYLICKLQHNMYKIYKNCLFWKAVKQWSISCERRLSSYLKSLHSATTPENRNSMV